MSVGEIAGEGGAWGIALLAAFAADGAPGQSLGDFLATEVFASAPLTTLAPDPSDVAGFSAYMERWTSGLAVERAAVASV